MFNNIKIKNFKSFKDLEIKELKRINLISGLNQSGKSNFLESIFILSAFNSSNQVCGHFSFRDFFLNKIEDLLFLFHNLDVDNSPIILEAEYEEHNIMIQIEPKRKAPFDSMTITFFENAKKVDSHTVEYKEKAFNIGAALSITQDPFIIRKLGHKGDWCIKYEYISSSNSSRNSYYSVLNMIDTGNRNRLIETLNKFFYENIEDISTDNNIVKVFKKGAKRALASNLFGDGFNKILSVISALFDGRDVILIDEIENGLHHTIYKKTIELIFSLAEENNVQIFITTHNKEMLETIENVLEENQKYQDNFMHHSLAKTLEGDNKGYLSNFEDFRSILQSSMDIRDE